MVGGPQSTLDLIIYYLLFKLLLRIAQKEFQRCYVDRVCSLGFPGHHSIDWPPELGECQHE